MTEQKILVIFYSLTGNTKFIAETMAKEIGADLLELKPKNEIKARSFMKYFWGGKQVMMKEKPKLLPMDKNPNDYDLIFIGTPAWAWNYSPPLRSFFNQVKLRNKKIGLFCCHGGQIGKTLTKMKKELDGNVILGAMDFFEPLKNNPEKNTTLSAKWAKEITAFYIPN